MKKKKLTFKQEAYKSLKKFLDTCILKEIRVEFKTGELLCGSRYYKGIKHLIYVFEEKIRETKKEEL